MKKLLEQLAGKGLCTVCGARVLPDFVPLRIVASNFERLTFVEERRATCPKYGGVVDWRKAGERLNLAIQKDMKSTS